MTPENVPTTIRAKLDSLTAGNSFDLQEKALHEQYAALWYEIDKSNAPESIKESVISQLDILFDNQYKLYGYTNEHKFYREAKIDLRKIIEIVKDSTSSISKSTQQMFADYIGIKIHGYANLLGRDSTAAPTLIRLRTLRDSLFNAIDKDTGIMYNNEKLKLKQKTGEIFENMIWKTKQYTTFEGDLSDAFPNFPNSMRKRLLMTILSSHDALLGLIDLNPDHLKQKSQKLSELIFGKYSIKGEANFLTERFLSGEDSDITPILRMEYAVDTWSLEDFDFNLNEAELNQLKGKVREILFKFSKLSGNTIMYRGDGSEKFWKTHGKNFLNDKYAVAKSFWLAYALYKEDSSTKFLPMSHDIGLTHPLLDHLRKNDYSNRFGKQTLIVLTKAIEMMYNLEIANVELGYQDYYDENKIFAFERAINDINNFIGQYYLGYSATEISNLPNFLKTIQDFFTAAKNQLYSSEYNRPFVSPTAYTTLNGYPDLLTHLKLIEDARGFPGIGKVFDIAIRMSFFNKRLTGFPKGDTKKPAFIDKLINKLKIVTPYKLGDKNLPTIIEELFKFSQDKPYTDAGIQLTGARTSVLHKDLAFGMRNSPHFVASEVPVWIELDNPFKGHIDLLMYDPVLNKLFVVDYKPDLDIDDTASYSFLNSVPQIVPYALTLQATTNIKVECIIFNKKGAWLFDPNDPNPTDPNSKGILEHIDDFMRSSRAPKPYVPLWDDFSDGFS